jgi:hypothetical protein
MRYRTWKFLKLPRIYRNGRMKSIRAFPIALTQEPNAPVLKTMSYPLACDIEMGWRTLFILNGPTGPRLKKIIYQRLKREDSSISDQLPKLVASIAANSTCFDADYQNLGKGYPASTPCTCQHVLTALSLLPILIRFRDPNPSNHFLKASSTWLSHYWAWAPTKCRGPNEVSCLLRSVKPETGLLA